MTDRIEKTLDLRASLERVWSALTDSEAFGQWFGVKLEGPFEPGKTTRGRITHAGYEHVVMEVVTQALQPKSLFAFTWHPYAIDAGTDYSTETPTRVEFHLTPIGDGVRLTVTESGFDALPAHRRAEAFRMNQSGWAEQMQNIRAYVGA